MFDELFNQYLPDRYSVRELMMSINYIIPRIIANNYLDENGNEIVNKYGYFKNAIESNFNKLNNLGKDLYSQEEIENTLKEIDCTFLSTNKVNGMRYEKHLSNPQEQRMILIEKYINELEEKKNEALRELIKIEKFISSIDDPDVRVIFNYRYVELKSWKGISKLVYMSERAVFYKHNIYLKK